MNLFDALKDAMRFMKIEKLQEQRSMGHTPSRANGHSNPSCTKRHFHESKTRRKMAAQSRKINRKR